MTRPIHCLRCDVEMAEDATHPLTGHWHGKEVTVVMRALVCPGCGYHTIHGKDFGEFSEKVRIAAGEPWPPLGAAI